MKKRYTKNLSNKTNKKKKKKKNKIIKFLVKNNTIWKSII